MVKFSVTAKLPNATSFILERPGFTGYFFTNDVVT